MSEASGADGGDRRGTKRPSESEDASKPGSQSPNNWQQAALSGGSDRKNKFMRLLGANKGQKSEENKAANVKEGESDGAVSTSSPVDENIHTVNDWEHANLQGGDQRKQKFMRLMGANKHHAPDEQASSARQHDDPSEIEKKLEEQYQHGLELKLSGAPRRHMGLGFHNEAPPQPDSSTASVPADPKPSATTEEQPSQSEAAVDSEATPKDSSQPSEQGKDNVKAKYGSMGFVKGDP